jgi:hypothetical protein
MTSRTSQGVEIKALLNTASTLTPPTGSRTAFGARHSVQPVSPMNSAYVTLHIWLARV